MKESEYTKRVCDSLIAFGAKILPIVASRMQPSSWPDRLVVHKSWVGLIEFKSARGVLRPAQAITIAELNKRTDGPWRAVVVYEGGVVEDQLGNHIGCFTSPIELLGLCQNALTPYPLTLHNYCDAPNCKEPATATWVTGSLKRHLEQASDKNSVLIYLTRVGASCGQFCHRHNPWSRFA